MRPTLPLAAALGAAALLAGCSNPCQDLGNRLCACVGTGTARDTCKAQVKNQLGDAKVTGAQDNFCTQKLDTCHVPATPADVQFCEWVNTADGKVACGLASPPALVDPATPLLDLPPETDPEAPAGPVPADPAP